MVELKKPSRNSARTGATAKASPGRAKDAKAGASQNHSDAAASHQQQRRKNPFGATPFGEYDFTRILQDFKMPGIDFDKLMNTQRKNIDAVMTANRVAFEGVQALTRRQTEILRQSLETTQHAMTEMMAGTPPEERMLRQTELTKTAFEKALANMHELAELMNKSNREAMNVINQRVTESMDEIKSLVETKTGPTGSGGRKPRG